MRLVEEAVRSGARQEAAAGILGLKARTLQRWVQDFVRWYNTRHRHSAIRYVTPEQRHLGQDKAILANRERVYEEARSRNPERWSRSIRDWSPVGEVSLNPDRKRKAKAQDDEAA